jgi:hypothetical protein
LKCWEASHERKQHARALEQADDQDSAKEGKRKEKKRQQGNDDIANKPQQGKVQKHGGAYPTGNDNYSKEGRRVVLLP